VFVTVTLVVVLISLNFLYKAGKLTSTKMRLQNAADAAAYSAAVVEARDLNFAAYINRAMIANEVAIGQMVGLHSWAFHWASFHYYLNGYFRQFIEPIFPPVTTPIVNTVSAGTRFMFQIPGNFLQPVFRTGANVGTTVLHNINKVFGYSQQGYHFASVLYAISAIDASLQDNVPDRDGDGSPDAKLSDYGMVTLLGHAATFGAVPSIPGSFVKTYRSTRPQTASNPPASGEPTPTENQQGMARFAALTRDSRDDFTLWRGWELPLYIPPILPLDIHESINFGFDAVVFSVDITITVDFELDFRLARYGASELRHAGSSSDGTKFRWEGVDTTGLSIHFHFSVDATIEACLLGVCGDVEVGGTATLSGGRLDLELRASLLGEDIVIPIVPNLPFPTSAPFAAGSAQVGSTASRNFNKGLVDMNTLTNDFDTEDYGQAHEHFGAWQAGVPFIPSFTDPVIPCVSPGGPCQVPTVATHIKLPKHKSNTSYKGLPSYLDTVPQTDPWAFEAPYLILGLVQDENIYGQNAPEPSGRLQLTDRLADEEVGVVAKAEVYFKRPTDLAWFRRADGLDEQGSAFNPYWNARLVQPTHADRMVALWLQQKENFYDGPFNPENWDLPDWADPRNWF